MLFCDCTRFDKKKKNCTKIAWTHGAPRKILHGAPEGHFEKNAKFNLEVIEGSVPAIEENYFPVCSVRKYSQSAA